MIKKMTTAKILLGISAYCLLGCIVTFIAEFIYDPIEYEFFEGYGSINFHIYIIGSILYLCIALSILFFGRKIIKYYLKNKDSEQYKVEYEEYRLTKENKKRAKIEEEKRQQQEIEQAKATVIEKPDNCLFELHGVNGQLYITHEFVIIESKDFIMIPDSINQKRIPFPNITSIQVRPAGEKIDGSIQFATIGGNKVTRGYSHHSHNTKEYENLISFTMKDNELVGKMKIFIQEKIKDGIANVNINNQLSAADEIMKLKKLLDDGIISEEEYNIKKNHIINN